LSHIAAFQHALECVVDHLHPETAPEIKLAKDIAAGAVLVASVAAVIVGVLMIVAILQR
jgi:undecaprenol kinase